MRKRKNNNLSTIILILLILAGLSLLLYPTVSNYILSLGYRRTIADFRTSMASVDDDTYERLMAEARAYNEWLAAKSTYMRDPTKEELEEYYTLLDPVDTGLMGYVVISRINVSLPIYHGTSDSALQSGVGHIPGTSLPVGGEGTHSIISGHRGMTSARLFTDIDQLVEGDTFTVRVLNEVLTYEVDQIKVILPQELGLEKIEAGEDYCTLLTCTPYGVNSHRLLVRGHRIPTPEEPEKPADPVQEILNPDDGRIFGLDAEIFYLIVAAVVVLPVILVIAVCAHRWRRDGKQARRLKKKEKQSKD